MPSNLKREFAKAFGFSAKSGTDGKHCKEGYAMVEVTGIPADPVTHNKELFFCLRNDNNSNFLGVYHRVLYKEHAHYPPPPGYENADYWPTWRIEAGVEGNTHEFHVFDSHPLITPSGRAYFGIYWNESDVYVLDMTHYDDYKHKPRDQWPLQHLNVGRKMSYSRMCEDGGCEKWGWHSPAAATLDQWGCMTEDTPDYPGVLIGGHYWSLAGQNQGPTRQPNDLRQALDTFKSYWPGVFGTRNFVIDHTMDEPHPWVMTGGKFDLSQFNEPYMQRIKTWADIHREKGCIMILDLFDHWGMTAEWDTNIWKPSNNHQGSYGLRDDGDKWVRFTDFYNLNRNGSWRNCIKTYVQRVASIVKGNPFVILCSGNEMVDGDENIRTAWHDQIGKWIKEVHPGAVYTINDHNNYDPPWRLEVVDMLSVHGLGGVYCSSGDHWGGDVDWNHWRQYGKPVLFDNDGLWHCRSVQHACEWWNLVKNVNKIYGAKMPWPNDTDGEHNWNSYSVPLLQCLRDNYA